MKKKLKSVFALLCAASLMLAAAGCGGKNQNETVGAIAVDENVTAPGELPIVKEPVTLTVGVLATSKVKDYKTNAFTKYLEEKTGINIEFYEFPSSGGYDKLNVMLASGTELPDVICGFGLDKSTILQYGSDGVFLDLTDYMDKYGYWIKEACEKTIVENIEGNLKTADGKKYFMPVIIEQQGNYYCGKSFINKTWLDKLGLSMPETIDEFADVMRAFRTKDPNGNGKADEIGFTGSTGGWNEKPVDFLMNSFIYDDFRDGFVVDDNYKISLNYTSQDYREGLKYIAKMAQEGLVDVQSYTQSNDVLRSLCSSDELTIGAFTSSSPDNLFPAGSERLRDFVALPPLKGPKGAAYAKVGDFSANSSGFITKYCDNPVAAFRFLDFMMSEEASIFARFGVEGTDWKPADENTKPLFGDLGFEARILPILPYGTVQNSHWFQLNPAFLSSDILDTMAWDGDELDGEYFKAKALKAYEGKGPKNSFVISQMLLDLEDMKEFNGLQTDISNFIKENVPLFITGKKSADSDWEDFQNSLKSLNVDRYLELAQKGYDAFRAEAGK
ncbi:MAG: extracellular solute-binding protein [Clostridiales bacterium]|nr:extracellular solute-binding protein [Clostridiales bacterium]